MGLFTREIRNSCSAPGSFFTMKRLGFFCVILPGMALLATEPTKPEPAAPPAVSAEEIHQAGKELFEALAPAEIKEQFEYPDQAQWDEFAVRLQRALASNDLHALAQYETEAHLALAALRTLSDGGQYADWLEERLDYIGAARQPAPPVPVTPAPSEPSVQFVPHYSLWVQRLQARPKPARADRLVPQLGAIFSAAGLPAELAWLAEAESTFNPSATSPVGARGLFQLMPATARELGLSTFLPDERTDPQKSAEAAAQLLRRLHRKFGDWPLALAAYNAGAGRVQRALEQQKAKSFAGIAAALPVETQMYVPKVLALMQVRAGMPLAKLAPARL